MIGLTDLIRRCETSVRLPRSQSQRSTDEIVAGGRRAKEVLRAAVQITHNVIDP